MSAVSETGRSGLVQATDRSTSELDIRYTPKARDSTCRNCGRPAAASKGRDLALPTLSDIRSPEFVTQKRSFDSKPHS